MKFLFSAFIFFFAFSAMSKDCSYLFDLEKSVIEGTGFKFTEKKGVTGKFPKFTLNQTEKKKTIKELLNGLVVTVDTMTVDSNNGLRDQNLREAFFSLISGNSEAVVTVEKVEKDKIITKFNLNGKTQPVIFTYKINGETIEAKGGVDVLNFSLSDAMKSLKKRCGALHTGSDGKSVTWSTFQLAVTAVTKKVCK